ncbi:FAD-dependent oxidoreductase [Aeromicrobium sp.]|uniref:FAD-dependent oxidoreductase n=1 Tax=Aeromicrobium sp. TaxID=1871063 RepID=UPI0028AB5D6E|nr:FAD-dependent oxidoreductase [Aeromicrobium sp.]
MSEQTPLWDVPVAPAAHDDLPETCDDLVIGAGIAGLTTGLLLARAGRRVSIVEGRYAGAGATGRSSAKVTLLQGTRLSTLLEKHDRDLVGAYVDANRAGFDWLVEFSEAHGVRIDRRTAATFAAQPSQVAQARAEYVAAQAMGLPVEWVDQLDEPFTTHGAATLADQAQVDPATLVTALVTQFRRAGGVLVEDARVEHVSWVGTPRATLADGRQVAPKSMVVTTGTPILDRSMAFADLEPSKSYLVAYELDAPPTTMALSAGSPTLSLREARTTDGRPVLLVGGHGHTVGRTSSEHEHVEALRTWTAEHFPQARELAAWSAQDYTTADGLPRFGRMPRGGGHIRFATGFAKWGFTNGPAAALAIAGDILGETPTSWAEALTHRSSPVVSIGERARINAGVAKEVATGVAGALLRSDSPLAEGQGAVHREGAKLVAESNVGGRVRRVQGLCTHLAGVLHWNDAEKTWDCPLHASRFAPDGQVLNGPATRPLACLDRDDQS